ncbi:hypothetical protein PROVRUST_05221 [Providencia rustigianii DSM 4541]|uniref:Uncharacterized protein n=1 Tax=Providencia rustigianii DSM 4541 TaxID=500637 RepID=D1NY95_9GAMM|nr:hypothetical protein PROVRUST_05221 [Providencia rustigianii DSM 4541]
MNICLSNLTISSKIRGRIALLSLRWQMKSKKEYRVLIINGF